MVDTKKLKARIIETGLTKETIAKELGISEHSLHNKISGITPFKADEAFHLAGLLGVADEMAPYFFVAEVAETATGKGETE